MRRVCRKILQECPKIDRNITLRLGIRAINDTMGPDGLLHFLLVFGCLPRFSAVHSDHRSHREGMRALHEARKEMSIITAELSIRKALMSQRPRNTDLVLELGDKVRVFRETDKKFIGPLSVIRIDGKQFCVIQNEIEMKYSLHQVIPAEEFSKSSMETQNWKDFENYSLILNLIQIQPMTKTMCSKITLPKFWDIQSHDHNPKKPRQQKEKKLEELIRRGTWKIVSFSEIPDNANIMTGGFVIKIKDTETDTPKFKDHFVIHGNKDKDKNTLVHTSNTTKHSYTRLLVPLAACFCFRIRSQGISRLIFSLLAN